MASVLTQREEALALRLARRQPESSGRLTELVERIAARAAAAALADPHVQQRVAGRRYRVLTVDYREDKPEGDGRPVRLGEVCIYDYDSDVLVVAAVDLRAGSVVEVFERPGAAPPVTAEELGEAGQLAAAVPDFAHALRRRGANVVAFPTPSCAFEARQGYERHRGATLYVGDVAVTVDLTAREVVPDDQLPDILRGRRGRATE